MHSVLLFQLILHNNTMCIVQVTRTDPLHMYTPHPSADFQLSSYSVHRSWQTNHSANKCSLLALVAERMGHDSSVSIVTWQCAG